MIIDVSLRKYILICIGVYALAQHEPTREEALNLYRELVAKAEKETKEKCLREK